MLQTLARYWTSKGNRLTLVSNKDANVGSTEAFPAKKGIDVSVFSVCGAFSDWDFDFFPMVILTVRVSRLSKDFWLKEKRKEKERKKECNGGGRIVALSLFLLRVTFFSVLLFLDLGTGSWYITWGIREMALVLQRHHAGCPTET